MSLVATKPIETTTNESISSLLSFVEKSKQELSPTQQLKITKTSILRKITKG
jgi:hypothetical protein